MHLHCSSSTNACEGNVAVTVLRAALGLALPVRAHPYRQNQANGARLSSLLSAWCQVGERLLSTLHYARRFGMSVARVVKR